VLNIQIAFQNEDDFVKNLICLRGELRALACASARWSAEGHASCNGCNARRAANAKK
jgi:hypothetical protein